MKLSLLICVLQLIISIDGSECNKKYFKYGFTCSCHEDNCDFFPPIALPGKSSYLRLSSSKKSDRFKLSTHELISVSGNASLESIVVNTTKKYQEILGFGGSVTDSAAIVALNLSSKTYETLIRSYYSTDGLEYNVLRVPIAGSDFSTRPYSYDDFPGDVELRNFSLTIEDLEYKIPVLETIFNVTSEEVLIYASPWSAPIWMKTNDEFKGKGVLRREYYGVWAKYLIKFLEAYKSLGFPMWGLTAQNEPLNGLIEGFPFNCMGWTAQTQREFIKHYLGPEMEKSGFSEVQLMILDDERFNLPGWADVVLSDPDANRYVNGIAVHWYWDMVPASLLSMTHERWPNHFIFSTEACTGYTDNRVRPGAWDRAEAYAMDIIDDLNNWVVGWMDWNLALDMTGGPNWARNFVDAPILVDVEKDTFYKQPMYYAMGHFSKLIPRGSIIIDSKGINVSASLNFVSALRQDGYIVTVVVNTGMQACPLSIEDVVRNVKIEDTVPAKSFTTYVWQAQDQSSRGDISSLSFADLMGLFYNMVAL